MKQALEGNFRHKFVFAWVFIDVSAVTRLKGISTLRAAVKQLLIDYESSTDTVSN